MTQDLLADSVERLLADCCAPASIREIERGAPIDGLWSALHESGFMDAMVPEARGGAGLCLCDVFSVVYACGRFAVPVPMAQTLMVRALLSAGGKSAPAGPITIAAGTRRESKERVCCPRVPYGLIAEWTLVDDGESLLLLPTKLAQITSTGVHASLEADIAWTDIPKEAIRVDVPHDISALGACQFAAQLAGAMARALEITTRYTNDRVQFGRPISKFQAIQHQLSVMAEHTFAARMAAQMGFASNTHLPNAEFAAVAKARTSEAALAVASIGHAVHGAMGFTGEYDLQLYTRRLHEWRAAYGSESYWNERIGTALLAQTDTTVDFIRARLFPMR
jgi:acyl-CoA dehydrogenase